MRKMTNGYMEQKKRLGEHIDVYLYGEKLEDHHFGLDQKTKQLVLD